MNKDDNDYAILWRENCAKLAFYEKDTGKLSLFPFW